MIEIIFSILTNSLTEYTFFIVSRAKCSFKNIYDLREGVVFLKGKKTIDFMKAAKEMAISLSTSSNYKCASDAPDQLVFQRYMQLLDS